MESLYTELGYSQRTVDPEYENQKNKFDGLMKDMNMCGTGLASILSHEKQAFSDAHTLAIGLSRIYMDGLASTDWEGVVCELNNSQAAEAFKLSWDHINDVLRSSTTAVCDEAGITPIRTSVAKIVPEVESTRKHREEKRKDKDSYHRRLQGYRKKQTDFEAQGKGSTSAATDNLNEIKRFEVKLDGCEKEYTALNQKVKADSISGKKAHDQLLDQMLIAFVVTQHTLYSRAAKELEKVISLLPQDKVRDINERIETYIKQGGVKRSTSVRLDPSGEPSAESDSKTPIAAPRSPTTTLPVAQPVVHSPSPMPSQPSSAAPLSPKSVPAAMPGVEMCLALYDHVADDDDELSFSAGEKIEVTEKCDGGWWKGKVRGAEGLFPVNYVKVL